MRRKETHTITSYIYILIICVVFMDLWQKHNKAITFERIYSINWNLMFAFDLILLIIIQFCWFGLAEFHGISTLVGYLMQILFIHIY